LLTKFPDIQLKYFFGGNILPGVLLKKRRDKMKLQKKYIALVVSVALLCFAVTALAMVAEENVTGTVVNSSSGYAIANDSDWYLVADYDVSDLLGKDVKATGSITEEDGVKTINVTSAEEVQQ
jgi:hypothetical protein